jgi:conjugative relaxase-like TrwC/TraI family protein
VLLMFRGRKVQPGDVREYAGYLTERVKDEAGYAASAPGKARQGDYYLGTPGEPSAEPLGVWAGKGAEHLGLAGSVEREHLERVWEGRDPHTGELAIRPGPTGEHVPAIDIVLSVPKSVSRAWAMEEDPEARARIERAATVAADAVVAIMERDCDLVARRVDGRMVREPAAGLVVSRFRHHTARTTDEQAARGDGADPDLHDHVVLANYALRQDGSWGAIDSLAFFRAQRVLTQLHYAQLERELQRIGYDTVRVGDQFELAGASWEGNVEFSNRSRVIDEAVAEFRAKYGHHPTPAQHQQLVRETRRGKDTNPEGDRERWRVREAAVDHRTLPAATEGPVAVPPTAMDAINERARLRYERGEAGQAFRSTELIAAGVLEELTTGPRRLSRENAVFDTQELHLAAAKALVGRDGADVVDEYPQILAAVTASPELVALDREHWTTRAHLELEKSVLAAAREKARLAELLAAVTGPDGPDPARVEWHIANAQVPLDAQQADDVRAQCDRRGLSLVLAEAGTGKGEVARVVADVYRELGYRVIAVSTAAERAQKFGRDIGADEAKSIDGLVHSCSRGFGLGAKTLVLADEVGQTDTYRWANLLRAAGTAALRGYGDTEQLDSVEAGGMLRVLERELGAAPLSTVYRTRDEDLVALWRKVRAGDPAAIDELDRRGGLVFVDTLPEAREGVVASWDAARVDGEQLKGRTMGEFLMATNISNPQVDQLNALAQQRRLERGEIGGPSAAGVFEDAAKGYRRAERFYAGDQVRLVGGAKLGDAYVRNGQTGRVVSIDEDGRAVVEIEGRREEQRARFAAREELARSRFEQAAGARRQGFEREQQEKRGRSLGRGVDGARVEDWQRQARERFESREASIREGFEGRWAGRRAEFVAADEGATVRLGEREMPLLRLGYAGHDQTTQGRTSQTIDAVIGREATDRQSAYVELSRAREAARFHVPMNQWQVPSERVVQPATAEREAVVEPIPREERIAMAKEALVEAFGRSRPKVAALEYQAQVLDELIRGEEERVDREREAIRQEASRPATERQLAHARGLGAEIPEGATWVEASTAIERATGAEPGAFAREALAARHDQERVDELLAQLAEARAASITPPSTGASRESAWRDVARAQEEPLPSPAEGRIAEPEADPTDRVDPVPGLSAPPDRPVSEPLAPEAGRASRGEPELASSDVAEPVSELGQEAWPSADTAAPEPALEVATEPALAPDEQTPSRLTTADLEAAEEAHLGELLGRAEPSVDRREEPEAEPDVEVAAAPVTLTSPERAMPLDIAESTTPALDAGELVSTPAPASDHEQDVAAVQTDELAQEAQSAVEAGQAAREAEEQAERQAEEDAARQAALEAEQTAERELAEQRDAERVAEAEVETRQQEIAAQGRREVEIAAEHELEVEHQAEPEPAAEPLGHEWGYDLWAEPTADYDDDRRDDRSMDMEM